MLRRLAVLVALGAVAGVGAAGAATPQELSITASDGARLACSLVDPDGTPSAGGWPAVMLFHGLGDSRRDTAQLATQVLAPAGYASLACDARGTGASEGSFGLDGPREVQDTRDLFAWLTARPEISDTQIGAVGPSLGGGAVLNAAVAGVPFRAIVPLITWTKLAAALAPQGLPKSGVVAYLGSIVPPDRWDPELLAGATALAAGAGSASFDALAAARSSASRLGSLSTPTLLVQGRHDFLFDADQALAAYRALRGPKRLYLTDAGHPPATNPSSEQATYVGLALQWLDRFLKGTRNGVERGAPVELAHDPWDGTTTTYKGLPATKTVSVLLPGTSALTGPAGKAVRRVRITGGPHDTFGDSTLVIPYSGAEGWDHLVAVLAVGGTPVTAGGVELNGPEGTATIRLMDEIVRIPPGARLTLTIASTSLATTLDPLYASPVGPAAKITLGRVRLDLSVLKQAAR